jgi:4-hydroxy-tetrahydrodipicolinate reductase
MLKIAIIGYGKMGKRIDELAHEHQLAVGVIIDNESDWSAKSDQLKKCDVALEFTTPQVAPVNVMRLLDAGIPVISGSTGWEDQLPEAVALATKHQVGLMTASNYSIGMNLFFALNKLLAQMMNDYPGYRPEVIETHHMHKLDAPSGTAKSLLKDMIGKLDTYDAWELCENPDARTIPVTAIREGEVTGIHEVKFAGEHDMISIRHEAMNRDGFVRGALEAAKWIIKNPGYQTMNTMLFGSEVI